MADGSIAQIENLRVEFQTKSGTVVGVMLGSLLVGVIVNAVNGAAIMFINYLVPTGLRPQLDLWLSK